MGGVATDVTRVVAAVDWVLVSPIEGPDPFRVLDPPPSSLIATANVPMTTMALVPMTADSSLTRPRRALWFC
jgi:hypothetical protein